MVSQICNLSSFPNPLPIHDVYMADCLAQHQQEKQVGFPSRALLLVSSIFSRLGMAKEWLSGWIMVQTLRPGYLPSQRNPLKFESTNVPLLQGDSCQLRANAGFSIGPVAPLHQC